MMVETIDTEHGIVNICITFDFIVPLPKISFTFRYMLRMLEHAYESR